MKIFSHLNGLAKALLLALSAVFVLGLASACGSSHENQDSSTAATNLVKPIVLQPLDDLPPVEARSIQACVDQYRTCTRSCDRVFDRGSARSDWCRGGCVDSARICARDSRYAD